MNRLERFEIWNYRRVLKIPWTEYKDFAKGKINERTEIIIINSQYSQRGVGNDSKN